MRRRNTAGYTILEVMIVLVVTAGLFVAAIVALGGRQAQTEAVQSVRDIEAKIQGITNDVSNGYYPNGFRCTADTIGSHVDLIAGAAPATIGANAGCIFLGKVVAFDSTQAHVITVVGRQFAKGIGSLDIALLKDARPMAVAQSGGPNVTEDYTYKYALKAFKMVRLSDNITPVGAIGFMSQLGGATGAANPLTGSRSTLLYGITSTATPNTDSVTILADKISYKDLSDTYNFVELPDGVRLCFKTGNGQNAEITIGANGSQTSTFVSMGSGANNVCN